MSITVAVNSCEHARRSDTAAERLGHLLTAQESLKKAIKAAREAALEEAGGQEALPLR